MRTFSIEFQGDASTLLQRAQTAARDNAAQLQGDEHQGTFAGSGVEGSYQVSGQTITITIHRKPFIAPWEMVENQLRKFFR